MKNLKWQRKSSVVFRDNAISWTLGPTWEKNPADLGGNRKRLSSGKEWQRSTLKLDNPIVSPTTENRSKSDQLTWKKKKTGGLNWRYIPWQWQLLIMLFLIRQIIFLGGGKSELPHVRQVVNRHRSVWKTLRSQETNRKDLRKEKKKSNQKRDA